MGKLNYWKFTCLLINLLYLSTAVSGELFAQHISKEAVNLLKKVDSVNRQSNGIEFKAELFARMQGNNYHQTALFKIQREPLKIYYRQYERNPIELLYDETIDTEKALINPAGFPYTNLRLSPYSSFILRRQHHSIFEADPAFMLDQLFYMIENCKPNKCIISLRDTIINNLKLKKITYRNLHYQVQPEKVTKDCNLLDLAQKYRVNFYSIVWQNKDIDINSDFEKGDVLYIPTAYGRKIDIIINPGQLRIYSLAVYDDAGLFEQFRYIWFRNNVKFSESDFQSDNPEYGF